MSESDPAPSRPIEPTDAQLIDYLRRWPRQRLREICAYYAIPHADDQHAGGYTVEARAIAQQLQRLRRAGRIRTEGQRWEVWRG